MTTPRPFPTEREIEWFNARVQHDPSGCWIWTGWTYPNGYGSTKIGPKTIYAHRFALLVANGTLTDGMDVMHRCDRRLCVNPAHLSEGTRSQNLVDARDKGRLKQGVRPMNMDKAREIRRLKAGGMSMKQIGRQLDLPYHVVNSVVYERNWREAA